MAIVNKLAGFRNSYLSIFITLTIITILIIVGPARATILQISTDKTSYSSDDDVVSFEIGINIEDNETLPINNITLNITPSNKICVFYPNGSIISGCENINIKVINNINYTKNTLSGYDYQYNQTYYFGFGYGYGYNSVTYELFYNITWNITAENVSDGNYSSRIAVSASNNNTQHIFYSDYVYFNIDRVPDIINAYSDSTKAEPKNVDEMITFYANWSGLSDSRLFVCKDNNTNLTGCNSYCSSNFSNSSLLNCSYTAQQDDNTTNNAYIFVCNSKFCSDSTLISFDVNHAPAINITLSPINVYANDTIIANATFSDIDSDYEKASTYEWAVNGIGVETGYIENQKYDNESNVENENINCNSGSDVRYGCFGGSWIIAESFNSLADGLLTKIRIYLSWYADSFGTNNITIKIRNTINGSDLATGTISGWSGNNTNRWKEITLDNPLIVENGKTYYLIITTPGTIYKQAMDLTSSYNGLFYYSSDSGTNWNSNTNYDILFSVYIIPSFNGFSKNDIITFSYLPKDEHGFGGDIGAISKTILNSKPVLNGTIPDKTWNKGNSLNNAFDLDDYFYDIDNDILNYTVEGNNHINVNINQTTHIVSFSQPSTWYGTEIVRFIANDSTNTTKSNNVTLTVKNTESNNGGTGTSGGSITTYIPTQEENKTKTTTKTENKTIKNKEENKITTNIQPIKQTQINETNKGNVVPLATWWPVIFLFIVLAGIIFTKIYKKRKNETR